MNSLERGRLSKEKYRLEQILKRLEQHAITLASLKPSAFNDERKSENEEAIEETRADIKKIGDSLTSLKTGVRKREYDSAQAAQPRLKVDNSAQSPAQPRLRAEVAPELTPEEVQEQIQEQARIDEQQQLEAQRLQLEQRLRDEDFMKNQATYLKEEQENTQRLKDEHVQEQQRLAAERLAAERLAAERLEDEKQLEAGRLEAGRLEDIRLKEERFLESQQYYQGRKEGEKDREERQSEMLARFNAQHRQPEQAAMQPIDPTREPINRENFYSIINARRAERAKPHLTAKEISDLDTLQSQTAKISPELRVALANYYGNPPGSAERDAAEQFVKEHKRRFGPTKNRGGRKTRKRKFRKTRRKNK